MSATRTQVYFTAAQRDALDRLARRQHKTLAEVVREAVDAHLERSPLDPDDALARTFGSIPDIDVPPRDEWDRGLG